MFTGIIQEVGTIVSIKPLKGGKEMMIDCRFASELKVDQSISINGVCHTITAQEESSFTVHSVEETLRKTNIGDLVKGQSVNLERSLRPDQLLDGHIVQGHADTTGVIKDIEHEGTNWLFTIEYNLKYSNLIVGRGSIAIDGISLTVAEEEANRFTVAIIPYTYEHTNFKNKEVGHTVNLEFDVLGKYVIKYLSSREN